MNWYIAKFIFHIQSGSRTPQFDEQLRLISANDTKEALQKARKTGAAEEHLFLNDRQETVHWKFIDISELTALNNFEDGMELYSKIEEAADERNYISFIRQKAMSIEQKATFNF